MRVLAYKEWISAELERCIGFWLKNGMDTENGGICTSLLNNGERYSKEKASGCKGVLHGLSRIFAIHMEIVMNGLMPQKAVLILWNLTAFKTRITFAYTSQ